MADQDFLGGMIADEEPAVVEPQDAAPVENVVEEPVTPEPTPQPEPAPEPTPEPEAPKDEPRHVPLATFLDKRDEARELKRRLDAYEAREREAQQRPEIDPLDDPQGYAAQLEQRIEQGRVQERFAISDRFARKEHGAETVEAAVTWASERAKEDPMFAASYMREADPVDWIVQQHKRDALLSDIGGNVDDWFAREAAKRGYAAISAPVEAAPVAAVVQPATKPAPPPRSIASERTDASRVSPQGERDGFLASIVGK
jgi:hypothetical protein